MPQKRVEYPFLHLFHNYIHEIQKGKHLQNNGKVISSGSIQNYKYLSLLLTKFNLLKKFRLRIKIVNDLNTKQFETEKKYWKKFYFSFTNYLYDELGHHDNYVGRNIKLLRCFFNYLISEKNMNVGTFHRKFYVPFEEVDIVVLSDERLNYLIHNKEMEEKLSVNLKQVKDVFTFGCSVALRYSDLMALQRSNVEKINNRFYIKVRSKKTQTFSRVKLPAYAINILKKYENRYPDKILPFFTKAFLNKKLKIIMEQYGFTEPISRVRHKRGVPEQVYKNAQTKSDFRFCDAVTTHSMRRSAITSLLSLGVTEQMVRQISGHGPNSKEFYRYISFAQSYVDIQMNKAHKKFNAKIFEP